MAVVTFDPFSFVVRYPEFKDVPASQLTAYFNDAGLYCDNTDASRIVNVAQRQSLLWMLTAHIASLGGAGGYGEVRPVGRVSHAEDGTTSTDLDYMKSTASSGPWYQQTQYGASYWQDTTSFRSFRYRARATQP